MDARKERGLQLAQRGNIVTLVLDFGAKPSLLSWYPFWRYAP
jgi:hypothetical protein